MIAGERDYQRIFTIVIDSLGVGAMPDAALYGDAGTDTLGHLAAGRRFPFPAYSGWGWPICIR